MSFGRFFVEAGPTKISKCGSCGVNLRRDPRVYSLLVVMSIFLVVIGVPLFLTLAAARLGFWEVVLSVLALAGAGAILTSFMSWRFIGWVLTLPMEHDHEN